MACNCHNFYDQDCEDAVCKEERLRIRTAVFDYMVCIQLEAQFGDEDE